MRVGRPVGFLRPAWLGTAASLMVGLAAGVSGLCYWHETDATFEGAGRMSAASLAAASADLFRVVPEGDDRRAHAPYPVEFEQQFPLIAVLLPPDPVPTLPPVARPSAAKTVASVPHRECAAGCGTAVALVAPLPPRRPDALRPAPRAEPITVVEVEAEPRPKIMSMPALPFLPAGRDVLRKVADLGSGFTASVGDFLDSTR